MESIMEMDSDDETAGAQGDPAFQNVHKYNAELESLISSAVLANVNKLYKRAIKLCLDILKINTRIPEAYELQAEAYENMPELDESARQAKAVEWLEMGCSVIPGNTHLAVKLAEAYWKSGRFKQADEEYTKLTRKYAEKARASNAEKKRIDIGILFKRAQAREKYSSDRTKVIDAYLDVLRSLKGNEQHADEGLSLMRKLLKECHQLDDAVRGLAVTEAYYDAFPSRLELPDIRALIELFVINEQFVKVIGVFRDRLGVQFAHEDGSAVDLSGGETQLAPFTCTIPTASIPACIECTSTSCGFVSMENEQELTSFVSFIDLYSRLFVALIRVGRTEAYRAYNRFVLRVRPIFHLHETSLSDAYLDIVDALMSASQFADASQLLGVLLSVEEFQLAAVYLKYGDALMQLDALASACTAYRNVIRLSAKQVDAHVRLLRALQRVDKLAASEAEQSTSQAHELQVSPESVGFDELKAFEIVAWINAHLRGEDPSVDLRESPKATIEALAEMLVSKCDRLYTLARRELDAAVAASDEKPSEWSSRKLVQELPLLTRFTQLARCLFTNEVAERTSENSLTALLFPPATELRVERSRQLGLLVDTRSEQQNNLTLIGVANGDQLYATYLRTCELLYESGQFEVMRRVSLHALIIPALVRDAGRMKEVNFQLVLASLVSRRLADVRLVMQLYFRREPRSPRQYSWFAMLALGLPHGDIGSTHRKNVYRLFSANPDEPKLVMLAAAAMYVSGFVKHALNEYLFLYKHAYLPLEEKYRDPMIPLMVGLCMLGLAGQQKVKVYRTGDRLKRQTLYALQALAFFNEYAHMRGETQETFYNLGRVMHQMSLFHLAIPYYKRVLEMEPVGDTAASKKVLDLKQEAAFNLCMIYRASGTHELATMLTEKYLVL